MHSLKLILSNLRYFSVVWVFASLNIMIGTWALYIPYVKTKLNLNDSEIGFALFCVGLGLLLVLPLVPILTKYIGLGRYTFIGICFFSLAFTMPLIATNYIFLCASLVIVGVFSGSTDVAMNTLVSQIEKEDQVNFMSSAHGFFSLGGAIGASIGTLFMVYFKVPFYHMLVMAFLVIASNLWLCKKYIKIREYQEITSEEKSKIKIFKPLLILAFLAFVVMSNEGAIEHWSAIYLIEVVKVPAENLSGFGFLLFSIMMTTGRFFGDSISQKIGSTKMIILGCVFASVGYIAVLLDVYEISILGFGIIGLGLSVMIPEVVRMAGKTKGIASSKSISFVSGIGFVGFLLGPVTLGYISYSYSLKISFKILFLMIVLALLVAFFLRLMPKLKQTRNAFR